MAPKLSLISSPQGSDGTRPLLEGGWKQESQCLRLDRQSRDGKGEYPTPQGLISMATLPPAQLLEGKAGAPGAGQSLEAFPHHPHLALTMTLRGHGQHQRQTLRSETSLASAFPGAQGHGDKRPTDRLPRDSLAVLITVCSEFQLEATDLTPLHPPARLP